MRACVVLVIAFLLPLVAGSALGKAKPGRYVVDAKGETVLDTTTKLTWQRFVPSAAATWQGAKDACKALALAGGGWRLPGVRELATLVDLGQLNPAIDKTAFPNTPAESFWSATAYSGSSSYAWNVYFNGGYSNSHGVTNTYRVRCVR
ncbi:MAG: DUF1566 domain-containing protein [Myxococcales bacterium]|nr:DUF1566 domain-containing protein [Myxococcales bacterium]